MNKNLLLVTIIAVIVIAVGTAGIFLLNKDDQASEDVMTKDQNESTMKKDESTDVMMKKDASYLEYSDEAYRQNSGKKRVLYFYANWCPICRPLDQEISQNSDKIPENVVILRVNYNDSDTDESEKSLADKYGVNYQHTFVQIDENENEINKWSGGEFDEILNNIK